MNANGTWPHDFINQYWIDRMTAFWRRMQRHVIENRDWAQNTWWMPRDADVKRVNWDNCHIENWDYQWFLDPTHRAPQWLDLTPAYRQWWIWSMLPTDSELQFYLAWINYEEGEYGTKIRQLQGWINEWNKLSQRSKMGFFDPVLPTAYVHERKMQVGANIDMSTPNPFNVSANAIDTAVLPGREEQVHGQPVAVTNVHVGTEFVYAGPTRHWLFAYPPLPAFQPNTRLWVTEIDSSNLYLLENSDHTIQYWIGARQLLRFLNKDILCIAPSARLDALRRGPRRHEPA